MIGIGVTTRNRPELIKKCVKMIKRHSPFKHKLVVIDDESDEPVQIDDVQVVRFNKRGGVAAGKNKCLEILHECEHVFLFDDDCWPIKDGWAQQYIDAAEKSDCFHFCYSWSTFGNGKINEFNSIEKRCEKKKVILRIEGWPDEILGDFIHDITVRMKKVERGLSSGHPHTQLVDVIYTINSYTNPCGVMLYLDKKCIDKVGGFDKKYGIWGGEHVGLSYRIHNAGFTPLGPFLDIENSSEYLYARDMEFGGDDKNLSVLADNEKSDNAHIVGSDKDSSEYVDFRSVDI